MEWADPCYWSRILVLRPRHSTSRTVAASILWEQEHLSHTHSELSRGSPGRSKLMQACIPLSTRAESHLRKYSQLISNKFVYLYLGLSKDKFKQTSKTTTYGYFWLFLKPHIYDLQSRYFFLQHFKFGGFLLIWRKTYKQKTSKLFSAIINCR